MFRLKRCVMKKINIIITILFVVFCLAQQGLAQPKVLIENPVFIFESVPEGISITHEFIVKNTGDTLLHIDNILPP